MNLGYIIDHWKNPNDLIKESYKYSEYNLIEFLKAIEVTLFDLRKEVVDTIDELNRHEKIR